jgi:hypothetical protein
MLVDIELINDPITDMISKMNGNDIGPKKLCQGVYLIGHFSLDNMIKPKPEFDKRYPDLNGFNSYGVCDNYNQVLSECHLLVESDRKFVMSVTPILKSKQEERGGWRWHKWGPYIGIQKRSGCEYLYDEPDIEKVFCYHIIEL